MRCGGEGGSDGPIYEGRSDHPMVNGGRKDPRRGGRPRRCGRPNPPRPPVGRWRRPASVPPSLRDRPGVTLVPPPAPWAHARPAVATEGRPSCTAAHPPRGASAACRQAYSAFYKKWMLTVCQGDEKHCLDQWIPHLASLQHPPFMEAQYHRHTPPGAPRRQRSAPCPGIHFKCTSRIEPCRKREKRPT